MTTQSEQALEHKLISQLESLGYSSVQLPNEVALLGNLQKQLEKHNGITFTDREFQRVLNHLGKGSVFQRAKILRGRMHLKLDNGESTYIRFINQDQWCKNEFQVMQQYTAEGVYTNRYDVTLLVNGLPVVQIELKRRGLELKEAFNQTNRYQRHSYAASYGLFNYIQFFVISNGVNTKYYANNRKQSFKQTFFWAREDNSSITQLDEFTNAFLEPCHMAKMIVRYTVLHEADKILMVLRPYQYYATEAILDRVKHSTKNGYIWHTTGSGKTLTSFKASQILTTMSEIKKVVFVVDRKDLDTQTIKEFNAFSKGSIDGTDNTKQLVTQFGDDTPLIVTTIQKLNNAIGKKQYAKTMEALRNEKVVFIFDECHRSQFGDTHKRITQYFTNAQMFGFTGTPIFAENAMRNQHGLRTTKELFDEQLHSYVITDAIRDENVLRFSIEYVGRYTEKAGSKNTVDIEVEDIDKQELLNAPERLEKITSYILSQHNAKTHARDFTAMFCVSSIDALTHYYELFRAKKQAGEHNVRVATIFSYTANEDDKDANGLLDTDVLATTGSLNQHSRDKLEEYIQEYNKMFGTEFSTKDSESFYNYYKDIGTKVKAGEIDILLVVNMFLTGFDSKRLNTLYVDKNLRYHGLIQAFSRTNRIVNEKKSQGNIVCFRNLKKATDEAVTLFSDKNAQEIIFTEPYEVQVRQFNEAAAVLLQLTPTPNSVNVLQDEVAELAFVKAFRAVLRIKNSLSTMADFSFVGLRLGEQEFEDFKSKYLDIYEKVRANSEKEKVSILDDVDFELELMHRDEVNVIYILQLLAQLNDIENDQAQAELRWRISDILAANTQLRSKRELIEKFIEENLPKIKDSDTVEEAFAEFWDIEKRAAFEKLCVKEGLQEEKVDEVIRQFIFTERTPLNDDIAAVLKQKPKLLERADVIGRVKKKVLSFIETFLVGNPE